TSIHPAPSTSCRRRGGRRDPGDGARVVHRQPGRAGDRLVPVPPPRLARGNPAGPRPPGILGLDQPAGWLRGGYSHVTRHHRRHAGYGRWARDPAGAWRSLVREQAAVLSPQLEHAAVLYRGDDEYVDAVLGFVAGGLERADPVFVAVPGPKVGLLRGHLGGQAARVTFADMTE